MKAPKAWWPCARGQMEDGNQWHKQSKSGRSSLRQGTPLPEGLRLESDPYLKGWERVKNLGSSGLDRKLSEAGWSFFYMAGEVNAMAFGSNSEKTIRRAVKSVIANMKSDRFNCLEISRVAAKSFLGLPYVSRRRPRATYSGKFVSLPRQTHFGMGSTKVGGRLNRGEIVKNQVPLRRTPMISARRLVVSVLGAMLITTPLIRPQDVKPPEAKVIALQPLATQEMGLQHRRIFDASLQAVPVLAPAMGARDLSRYRNFQFGEALPALAKQAGLELSNVKLIHTRPALIQELEWPIWLSGGSSPQTDPVKTILFSFYNGELFRIVVNYDREETEGLTSGDMIEAISATYGTAAKPVNTEIAFSSTEVYDESEPIIARWEDSQYSFNLYRSAYQPTFGMIAFAKRLDAQARTATAEANRLDAQAAPQREIQRQQGEDEKNRESLEKARQVNKSNFHP